MTCPVETQEVYVHSIPSFSNKSKYQQFTLQALLADKLDTKNVETELSPIVFAKIRTSKGKDGKFKLAKVLLDTGCTTSIVNQDLVKKLTWNKGPKIRWKTTAGYFQTGNKVTIDFTLPELWEKREVKSSVHVTDQNMGYDLILGIDLLREISIDILPSRDVITWDDAEIPLRPRDITAKEVFNQSPSLEDPTAVKEAVSRIESILDAKYEKADLKNIV